MIDCVNMITFEDVVWDDDFAIVRRRREISIKIRHSKEGFEKMEKGWKCLISLGEVCGWSRS
jgi:hypothetical protein